MTQEMLNFIIKNRISNYSEFVEKYKKSKKTTFTEDDIKAAKVDLMNFFEELKDDFSLYYSHKEKDMFVIEQLALAFCIGVVFILASRYGANLNVYTICSFCLGVWCFGFYLTKKQKKYKVFYLKDIENKIKKHAKKYIEEK